MRSRVETAAAFFILDWPKIWMLKEAIRSGESAALAPPPGLQHRNKRQRLKNKGTAPFRNTGLIRTPASNFSMGDIYS
jgi:hypothetical protein